jgi:hypothetical protein
LSIGLAILDERFADVDHRLAKALKDARNWTTHRGVRGDGLASVLGKEIRDHFVDCDSTQERCEIRDTHCALSQEVDLVLLNRFHPPFLLKHPRVLFIEGVLAAAEVKTSLDKGETVDCLAKAQTFKRLRSELTDKDFKSHAVDEPDRDRYLVRRPFFAFAYDDSRSLRTVQKNVEEWVNDNRVPDAEQIDAIFVLNKGIVVNLGASTGAIEITGKNADMLGGFARKDTSSIFSQLMVWLSLVCPSFTSLDPILLRYASFDADGYVR